MKSPNQKASRIAITIIVFVLSMGLISAQPLDNYNLLQDVSYGPDEQQNMDIYLSLETNDLSEKCTIVFLHGGGYYISDKSLEERYIQPYLERGFNVVNLNYRLKRGIPLATEDLTTALNFLQANKSAYNLELKRIVVTGFSAGAHIATNVGVAQNDKAYLHKLNKKIEIIGIINFSGPVAGLDIVEKVFMDHEMELFRTVGNALFPDTDDYAPRETLAIYEPITYLDQKDPAIFLWYGGLDDQIPPQTFKKFVTLLNQNPDKNVVIFDPDAAHSPTDESLEETYQQIFEFIDRL